VLECVINISEGQDTDLLDELRAACATALLDVHTDAHHHRSVFTLSGTDVQEAARSLTRRATQLLDIRRHAGVHPRIGIVDVVPFVPVPDTDSTMADAVQARDAFAQWVSTELHIPAFLYGDNRSLPEVRKNAFTALSPDFGPPTPHETAGAVAVGHRPVLIAYNLWLAVDDIRRARSIAREIRRPGLRTLGLDVGGRPQVSCNLIDWNLVGPELTYDLVHERTPVQRAELVGLLPRAALLEQTADRWPELDLDDTKTIEARLSSLRGDEAGSNQ
jgi:glutamate formiminotransferase